MGYKYGASKELTGEDLKEFSKSISEGERELKSTDSFILVSLNNHTEDEDRDYEITTVIGTICSPEKLMKMQRAIEEIDIKLKKTVVNGMMSILADKLGFDE